jgi:hypothetical protein
MPFTDTISTNGAHVSTGRAHRGVVLAVILVGSCWLIDVSILMAPLPRIHADSSPTASRPP